MLNCVTSIQTVLTAVRDRLESTLQSADPRPDEWATLSNMVDHDGRVLESARNRIVMTVVSLQSDTVVANFGGAHPTAGDQFAIKPAPLHLNLHLLVTANFGEANYPAGLEVMSRTLGFFQQNPVFTPAILPDLPRDVSRLALEFVNADLGQLNHLMGMLGVKYLPCALYRVRMLRFDGQAVSGFAGPARSMEPRGRPTHAPTNPPRFRNGAPRPVKAADE